MVEIFETTSLTFNGAMLFEQFALMEGMTKWSNMLPLNRSKIV